MDKFSVYTPLSPAHLLAVSGQAGGHAQPSPAAVAPMGRAALLLNGCRVCMDAAALPPAAYIKGKSCVLAQAANWCAFSVCTAAP